MDNQKSENVLFHKLIEVENRAGERESEKSVTVNTRKSGKENWFHFRANILLHVLFQFAARILFLDCSLSSLIYLCIDQSYFHGLFLRRKSYIYISSGCLLREFCRYARFFLRFLRLIKNLKLRNQTNYYYRLF